MIRRCLAASVAIAGLLAPLAGAARQAHPRDHALIARNILPPGESGSLAFPPSATDQLHMYDRLTPLFDQVTARDIASDFKPETLGLGGAKPVRVEHPRGDVRILRDRWDVPHVYGKTRAGVEFGAGWVTAEDRGLLMELLRGPGRISALDVPGVDAFAVANAARQFIPSAQANAALHAQVGLVQRSGARGRQLLKDVDAYIAGVNAYNKANGDFAAKWTREDVIAVGTLVGANFGVGGGDEVRRAEFLSALQQRLGPAQGRAVFDDLREQQDPEAPVSAPGLFPFHGATGEGNIAIDAGSFVPWGGSSASSYRPARASNAILLAGSRSSTHHPLFLAGPQVGYLFPEYLLELDLHGGGFDARGVAFPGLSFYLQIGRGIDYAWSATSASSDVVDQFAEQLCGDDTHYLYKGDCRAMQTVDAGLLKGKGGEPDRELVYRTTVHGPVVGYATSHGTRVAIASDRSTRGRELLAAIPFQVLSTNGVRSAKDFVATMSRFELTFNWFYADDRDIAMVSSGRIPVRAPDVDLGLPANGNGSEDWRGFVERSSLVHTIDPPGGAIVNWNNKPGTNLPASDSNWSFGSIQRVQLLKEGVAARRVHTPASLVSAMNRAATQDLRAIELVPTLAEVLHGGPAPNARDAQMLELLEAWRAAGGSRLDRDGDGRIDDPGAAIMDAAWPRLADAVLAPVLGSLTDRLPTLISRNENASPHGSAYAEGWYGYVDKDLRALLGKPVTGAFHVRYCGGGDLAACRASLWAAVDAAGNALAAAQGPDPAAWRADATVERIGFGLLPNTMRWANRPTFQQLVSFGSHRPRR